MQCEFSQAELVMLDLGIIERRDRIRFALMNHDPSEKQAKSVKSLLETDLKFIDKLDIKGE